MGRKRQRREGKKNNGDERGTRRACSNKGKKEKGRGKEEKEVEEEGEIDIVSSRLNTI